MARKRRPMMMSDLKLAFGGNADQNRRLLTSSMHETAEGEAGEDLEIEVTPGHVLTLVATRYPKIVLLLFKYFGRTLDHRKATMDDDRFFTMPPDLRDQIPVFFGQHWPPSRDHWILCVLAAPGHLDNVRFRIADGD